MPHIQDSTASSVVRMGSYNIVDGLGIDDTPNSLDDYREIYRKSTEDPAAYWANKARQLLDWDHDFRTINSGNFCDGNTAWFLEGRINASYNCIDRHAHRNPNKIAIISEYDEVGKGRKITFGELLGEVSRLSHVLKDLGVQKGDIIAIYLPNIPEALVAMLACARIGAVHSVVFMGFSAASLRDRILDARSKLVITTDEARRGGKTIPTKAIVDEALLQCPLVKSCLVMKHTSSDIPWCSSRDLWWQEETQKWPAYYPPESMSAEDPLFILYTSGSTGKPKGLIHTTAGFLLGAMTTTQYVFDMQETDRHFCAGDVGWITGHTYLVYGPLLVGATTLIFEGTPAYPSFSRFWDIVDEHRVTHFYAAPTALRILKRAGDSHVTAPMKELRVLGSIGEPIAPEVWKWYSEIVGRNRATIVDTETGCHVIAPLAGSIPTKPGCCTVPFFGIEPAILDPVSGDELHGEAEGVLAIKNPWPSMARTIYRDHMRYIDTYFKTYPGYYVEAALLASPLVAEAAAVGANDDLTGQSLVAYITLKETGKQTENIQPALIDLVRKAIGAFATPKRLLFVPDLPKTRSGKIMRRILRKILEGERENFGDTSTHALAVERFSLHCQDTDARSQLLDPDIIQNIITVVESE
ncbi:Acetyl-coenzyme A synthetase protein [Rutstroemia sp. NJR-2017a BBW]|nr:Acetyl-coenzyme A synthetase protein [Rutstroemia sp. NJR-2017a BBW]